MKGLQNALLKFHLYCNKWQLTVNTSKTKTMVFQNGNTETTPLLYNGNYLSEVKDFKFLGNIIQDILKIKRNTSTYSN